MKSVAYVSIRRYIRTTTTTTTTTTNAATAVASITYTK